MQIVSQDPYSLLNQRLKVGSAIAEPAVVTESAARKDRTSNVAEMLSLVGLPEGAANR
jgi:ABC-type microcin C transport system duplicated ATPase subunit YejF